MQKKSTVIVRLAVFALILIVVNMISSKMYFRLDFTEDQRYTLSDATTDVLSDLEDVITVKAYFSEDLPAQLISNRQDFEDLLLEYENRSGGNVVYEFISPNENEEKEAEAQQNGIQPVIINVSEKDQVQQLKAYMGAVLMMDDRQEVIPLVQPGVSMEYDLTTSIKKLAVVSKPKLAVLQGHGEPTLQEIPQLAQQLSVLYEVEPVDLAQALEITADYKAVAWINPSDTIAPANLAKLDKYLENGGNMFVAYSNMSNDLSSGYLTKGPNIGIEGWLAAKGVRMGSQYVVDDNAGSVSVQQRVSFGVMSQRIKFPYFPVLTNFPDHSITSGLETLMLPMVSNLTVMSRDSSLVATTLLETSEMSGLAPTPVMIDVNKKWGRGDFTQGPQTLAVALEGALVGNQTSRLLVVANGQFVINGNPPQQISQDNVNFASNSIDWLADDTGLIDLRTKGITSRPLETVEDSTREMLKWGNLLIPILLVFVYAFIRRQLYLKKKQGWLEGNY